jgi:hypothetical protein
MDSVAAQAHELRKIAEAGPIGKRHSSFELYRLLGQCAVLADRCATGQENAELRSLVAQRSQRGHRTWVERGSDEFTLVCRFVFGDLRSKGAERSNASRYAHCLRQARRLGIKSPDLAHHLSEQGGVNALFLVRPLEATSVMTKCLNLTTSISVPKAEPITLTLQRTSDNRYEVLQCMTGET